MDIAAFNPMSLDRLKKVLAIQNID